MVGPGEVDEDLEPETAEECSKYGKVMRCVIFEVTSSSVTVMRSSKLSLPKPDTLHLLLHPFPLMWG